MATETRIEAPIQHGAMTLTNEDRETLAAQLRLRVTGEVRFDDGEPGALCDRRLELSPGADRRGAPARRRMM